MKFTVKWNIPKGSVVDAEARFLKTDAVPPAGVKIRAGQVYINSYGAGGGVELPFGGVGKSGHGREKGFAALYEFVYPKAIVNRHG